MKIILFTFSCLLISLASMAQTNPGTTMQEPNYYLEGNPATLREAGRLLQKHSRDYYLGTGLLFGGYILTYGAIASNEPNVALATVGSLAAVAGFVLQIISHKHIGKAGQIMERGAFNNLQIQGSSGGLGLRLAYHF